MGWNDMMVGFVFVEAPICGFFESDGELTGAQLSHHAH